MNLYAAMIISSLASASVFGLIIGVVKGYSKVKSWAVEYLLATFIAVGIGGAVSKTFADDAGVGGVVVLAVAIGLLLAFASVFALLRKGFAKHRNKVKGGFLNFLNRILGGITLAAKGFVICGLIWAGLLAVIDLAQLEALGIELLSNVLEPLKEIYASEIWIGAKPLIMDFMIVGVILASIKCGYSSGISSVLWALTVLGLLAGAGFIAWHLAFNVESFSGAVTAIQNAVANLAGEIELPTEEIARWILTAGLFLCMLVVIILLAIFVPRFLSFARDSKIFFVIDGTAGALVATALSVGVLLFLGGVLQTINDLPFMEIFNTYFEGSQIASCFYMNNILSAFGAIPDLPLRDWLVPAAE